MLFGPTALLALAAVAQTVHGFKFNVLTNVTQCGRMKIEWNAGGSKPFKLTMLPVQFDAKELQIPDSAVKPDGSGSVEVEVPFEVGKKVVFVMSDAVSFGSGGASNMYTVGPTQGSDSCTLVTADPNGWYWYATNSADHTGADNKQLKQCQPMQFLWGAPGGFEAPNVPKGGDVVITGVIPGGSVWQFPKVPASTGYYNWTSNIQAGNEFYFHFWDTVGGFGGSSDTMMATDSPKSDCLNGLSPRPTPVGFASEKTDGSKGVAPGVIAGAVIAAVVGLALLAGLGFFFWRRNKRNAKEKNMRPQPLEHNVDLFDGTESKGGGSHQARQAENGYLAPDAEVTPFMSSSSRFSGATSTWQDTDSAGNRGSHLPPGAGLGLGQQLSLHGGSQSAPSTTDASEYSHAQAAPLPAKRRARPQEAAPLIMHSDAGRVPSSSMPAAPAAEELPPNYNPEWEADRDEPEPGHAAPRP